MNPVGISPVHSDSGDSSDDEEFNLEAKALIQQALSMQETLHGRFQQVQEMNRADMDALQKMDYLLGVNFTIQNLAKSGQEMNQIQQNLSSTLRKGESAIISKQKELNALQTQVANLRQTLNHTEQNPMINFTTELGKRVCEYISNPKSGAKHYAAKSKYSHT